ncbi:divalent metal cation transporter, partial [Acinetobacter baumannii]|nr:divalent metal cation transporter [Acinetobacter baumannii]
MGFRKIEAIVVCLIIVILAVFVYQVALSNPDWGGVIKGLVPTADTFSGSKSVAGMTPLSGALGIIGATVMPHNLYLHSAISQTRKVDHHDEEDIARTVKFSAWDANIQLSFAFVV